MEQLFQALIAWTSLGLALVAPPLFVARKLTADGCRGSKVLNALVLGCASQGLLGLFWNWRIQRHPGAEAAWYYGFWLAASLLVIRKSAPKAHEDSELRGEGVWLVAILLAAALVRLLHPLGHAALGQSDAYSHLQFMRQVVADGMIHNQIYPPAYSWLMALPSITFGVDPYWLARYGGVFWGTGLVLALFVLARGAGCPWAGLVAGALAAFCPAWMPLLKTGVGVYANQAGLFLVPIILVHYARLNRRGACGYLLIASSVLAAAVPMMWISLMPVLLADRLFAGLVRESNWVRRSGFSALALMPALGLMFWQSARMQGLDREVTVAIVTAGEWMPSPAVSSEGDHRPPSAEAVLLKNFLSIKRMGYGDWRMNAAGIGLGLVFWMALQTGMRRKNPEVRLLGIWGLVTSVQAGTGFLQFAGYQREGWALLMATAWLGGVVGSVLLEWRRARMVWRGLALGVFAAFFLWTLRHPPGHAASFSTAEDELIAVARAAARRASQNRPLTIVARSFSGFHGNQGDLIEAAVGRSARVSSIAVGPDSVWREKEGEYLFLMDRFPFDTTWSPGLFASVQPEQVSQYLEAHRRLFQLNRIVEEWMNNLQANRWTREHLSTSDGLQAIWVQPRVQ